MVKVLTHTCQHVILNIEVIEMISKTVYVLLYFTGCCGDEVHYMGDKDGLREYCKENNINISQLERDHYNVNGEYKAYTVLRDMDYTILIKNMGGNINERTTNQRRYKEGGK